MAITEVGDIYLFQPKTRLGYRRLGEPEPEPDPTEKFFFVEVVNVTAVGQVLVRVHNPHGFDTEALPVERIRVLLDTGMWRQIGSEGERWNPR
jgi:hypothetical protein